MNLFSILQIAREAGDLIMEIYNTDFEVEYKEDQSPLTLADRKANQHIVKSLKGLSADIPVLSEESKTIPYADRKDWDTFWLVDPVDGTKEFIKKNGEFTVNIALVKHQLPEMGVVLAPAKDLVYFSSEETGAFRCSIEVLKKSKTWEDLMDSAQFLPADSDRETFTVVGSRSHMNEQTEAFIHKKRQEHGEIELISAGSSLKLCLVAEGSADVYPRFAPTMEWDTAAGHAIALGAGCEVINPETGEALRYNKENLLNPWFVVQAR